MSSRATATATCNCGWTGGPYRSPKQAAYALTRHSCDRQAMLQARQARVDARKTASGPKRDCACPIAHHDHGTRNAYVVDKCRCRPCRDAAAAYERRRAKDRAYGRQAYVPAGHARTHVLHLMSQGMGWKRVAAAAGIESSVVWKLIYGDPSRNLAPSKRVTPRTAAALLAVTLDLADGATVDATGTARRLQALVAMGWSQQKLAARLGMTGSNIGPIVHGTRGVTHGTAKAVTALYDDLWDTPAPAATKWDKVARANALNAARRHGWVSPLAWDDDTIDDPAARPDIGQRLDHGGRRIHVDDIEWLLSQEDHTWLSLPARLDITRSAIDRALRRAGRTDLLERITTNSRGSAA